MRIGIVGSGQLGWMMILEGRKLGLEFNVTGRESSDPASRIADSFYENKNYREFVRNSDCITYEFEHVDRKILELADEEHKLFPSIGAVDLKMDRSREKEFFRKTGVPTAEFAVAENPEEALALAKSFDRAVIKKCFEGYDGKGQAVVAGNKIITDSGVTGKCIVEEFIDFDYEASIISFRDRRGKMGCFPPSLNVNSNGMLVNNECPVDDSGMRDIAFRLMESLDYTGVMGIEFFIRNGKALVNEFSPRVHNSGHHTLMGSSISQFEQHVRILSDIPTSDPLLYSPSGIVNVIGKEDRATLYEILRIENTQVYIYGKQPRRRRKLGHVNVTAPTKAALHDKIIKIQNMLYGDSIDTQLAP